MGGVITAVQGLLFWLKKGKKLCKSWGQGRKEERGKKITGKVKKGKRIRKPNSRTSMRSGDPKELLLRRCPHVQNEGWKGGRGAVLLSSGREAKGGGEKNVSTAAISNLQS